MDELLATAQEWEACIRVALIQVALIQENVGLGVSTPAKGFSVLSRRYTRTARAVTARIRSNGRFLAGDDGSLTFFDGSWSE